MKINYNPGEGAIYLEPQFKEEMDQMQDVIRDLYNANRINSLQKVETGEGKTGWMIYLLVDD